MSAIDIIKILCDSEGITISALEKELGYGNGSLAKATKLPADRIFEIAKRFNVTMEYILSGDNKSMPSAEYYLDDEARDMAEFIFQNPDYKVLFDASRKVKKDDIEFVKNMIDRLSKNDESL